MEALILAAALVGPLRLDCAGTMLAIDRDVRERASMLVTVHQDETVDIGSWGVASLKPMGDDAVLWFGTPTRPAIGAQIPNGTINRYTGKALIFIRTTTDGLYRFDGQCRPAVRLF